MTGEGARAAPVDRLTSARRHRKIALLRPSTHEGRTPTPPSIQNGLHRTAASPNRELSFRAERTLAGLANPAQRLVPRPGNRGRLRRSGHASIAVDRLVLARHCRRSRLERRVHEHSRRKTGGCRPPKPTSPRRASEGCRRRSGSGRCARRRSRWRYRSRPAALESCRSVNLSVCLQERGPPSLPPIIRLAALVDADRTSDG